MAHVERSINQTQKHTQSEAPSSFQYSFIGISLYFTFSMPRKRFFETPEPKTGLEHAQYFLKKIGLGPNNYYFWKQMGKALACTYAVMGAAWLYNETSPLGWWTLKPMPKEEKELEHLYQRREFPYPGDEEAMEEFIKKGGMIGTTIGPKGMVENDMDESDYKKELKDKKFEQEAQKLWFRVRNEVIGELQEKGFDVDQ